MLPLTRVRRAAERRTRSEQEWREAIRAALAHHSLREVADAAGISHVRVLQIRDGK